MARTFHPDNCRSVVRAQVSFCGMAVTLVGKHAFEWSVCIDDGNSIKIIQFSGRVEATKEFNKYKRQAKTPKKPRR